jgi:dephospho-CoA kinase
VACGKSTASKFFVNYLQLKIIDCDVLAREIVEPGKPAYNMIVERFGASVLTGS